MADPRRHLQGNLGCEEDTAGGLTTQEGVRCSLQEALEDGDDPAEDTETIVCPHTLGTVQGVAAGRSNRHRV